MWKDMDRKNTGVIDRCMKKTKSLAKVKKHFGFKIVILLIGKFRIPKKFNSPQRHTNRHGFSRNFFWYSSASLRPCGENLLFMLLIFNGGGWFSGFTRTPEPLSPGTLFIKQPNNPWSTFS